MTMWNVLAKRRRPGVEGNEGGGPDGANPETGACHSHPEIPTTWRHIPSG